MESIEDTIAGIGKAAQELLLRVYDGAVLTQSTDREHFLWRADGQVVSDAAVQELKERRLILLLPPGLQEVPLTGLGRAVAERLRSARGVE